MRYFIIASCLFLTYGLLPPHAYAGSCEPIQANSQLLFKLGMQYEQGCFGGDADSDALTKEVLKKAPFVVDTMYWYN